MDPAGGGRVLAPEMLALLAVEETGTVTGAAGRLHLSQPALSRQLQRLGRAVGAPVVERRGRRAALTPAGLLLAACARRQARDWEATLAAVAGRGEPPLRLGCGSSPALTLLPAALRRLGAAEPGLAFRVLSADSAAVALRCLEGEVDAGLVTPAPADRRLLVLPLLSDPVRAVGPAGGPGRLTLAALAAGPLCLPARGSGFRTFVDGLFSAAGLRPEPAAEVDGLEALRELVAAGLGRALLPRSVVAAAVGAGRLAVLEVPDLPPAARTIALVRRADRPPHPLFERLHAALRAAAAGIGGGEGPA
jgi:DNA-binding transcriptional LysR family regulator